MPGRPPQVAWRYSRNELSAKAGTVHSRSVVFPDQLATPPARRLQAVRVGWPARGSKMGAVAVSAGAKWEQKVRRG